MKTKLVKNNKLAIVPAGIMEGIEPFFYNDEKWVLLEGKASRFHDCPGTVQRLIANAFMNDTRSRKYLEKKMGITAFSEGFEWWYKCVVGGLDHVPDFDNNGDFTPDKFNNMCTNYQCPHRGEFCGLVNNLKDFEVRSIRALKAGRTIKEAAQSEFISVAAMKSRLLVIREKLKAPNMAAMIARATEMGV